MWWALEGLAVETTTSLSETRNICSQHENNEGLSDQANRKWGTDGSGRLIEDWNEWQLCFDNWHYGFHYFLGPSLYCGKRLLNARANWQVYTTAWQMYTPNVECRTTKKKTWICLVIFCIILAWIYSKLSKIQKLTKQCTDCEIHGSWLKDAFINDQCLHFVSSLLSNIQHYLLSF